MVIQVEKLSKQYRLGKIGTGSFAHDVNRWWHKVRGKEDPYLKIGEVNDRTVKGESEYVWSLRDINFSIKQGDSVGIIGRNGAGKSTLLKILSRVTVPTTGRIRVKGRLASLLEVGTGFHPELTGRENIFLNGAILGMTKQEIKSKFDEIVDFSGIERYIDTPVKRYSSGMYVRLAFGVAAHLEPEILIVDEVLAVGDAEFQKKALGKMKSISASEGRTVLFVSHNMGAIRRLCTKGIFLQHGKLVKAGDITEIVDLYLMGDGKNTARVVRLDHNPEKPLSITEISICAEGQNPDSVFDITDKLNVRIRYAVNEDVRGVNIALTVNKDGYTLFSTWDIDNDLDLFTMRKKGEYITELTLPDYLKAGTYTLTVACGRPGIGSFTVLEDVITFDIENIKVDGSHKSVSRNGLIKTNVSWHTKTV